MASNLYTVNYTNLLEQLQGKYSKLKNLWNLKHIRDKIKCYENVQNVLRKDKTKKIQGRSVNHVDQYYNCFMQVENKQHSTTRSLIQNIQQIQDQYSTCLSDCRDNFKEDSEIKERNKCQSGCGTRFKTSIMFLYENFYRTSLGQQPQYQSAKK